MTGSRELSLTLLLQQKNRAVILHELRTQTRDMTERLNKIVTRTGDKGTTGLADGSRRQKDDLRIQCLGSIDELNAWIGLLSSDPDVKDGEWLIRIQHRLFDLGAEISVPASHKLTKAHLSELETQISKMNEPLPPLKEFVLPGGSHLLAQIHIARTVCRRAERDLVGLEKSESGNPLSLQYLNRLSDWLFVFARHQARLTATDEVLWNPNLSSTIDEP